MDKSLMEKKQYEEESYNQKAANWWAEKIQGNKERPIKCLKEFTNRLSFMIRRINSFQGSMIISTCTSPSRLLNKVALDTKLDPSYIPVGYEMRIMFDMVHIYNQYGMLVASF